MNWKEYATMSGVFGIDVVDGTRWYSFRRPDNKLNGGEVVWDRFRLSHGWDQEGPCLISEVAPDEEIVAAKDLEKFALFLLAMYEDWVENGGEA